VHDEVFEVADLPAGAEQVAGEQLLLAAEP